MLNLPSFIVTDWPRKLVAFFCACLVWYTVHRQIQEKQVFRDIPLILDYPDYLTVNHEDLPKINVTLRGPKRRLNSVTNADIKVTGYVSKDATSGGSYEVLLRPKNIETPRGIKIDHIQPDTIKVNVDTILNREIPIRSRFTGQLPEGYDRKSVFFVPKNAQVKGPSKIVSRIKEIRTEPIELDQSIQDDFEIEVRLETIRHITVTPESIQVTVELYKKFDSKFFGNLDILEVNSIDTDFYIEKFINPNLPKVEAVLRGPKSTVDILTSSSLRAFVDISDITVFGSYRLPIHLWVDANDCSVVEIKPMIAEVKINSRPKSNEQE